MRRPSNPRHAVRRVVLPSGKTIEIVYFSDAPGAEATAPAPAPPSEPRPCSDELHVCPTCESPLVHPTDWEQVGDAEWDLNLRCPNCEWGERSMHSQEQVEAFDEILNGGTDTLIDSLERLTRDNMEADIERFVAALESGLIQPFDF